MRVSVALFLVGCGQQSHHEPDAPPWLSACSSAGGTANVVLQMNAPEKVYDRAYAGGIIEMGVNGVSGFPFSLRLTFTNQSPVPVCCGTPDPPDHSCCSDALLARVDFLVDGGELGDHAANVFDVLGFSAPGTLTITEWNDPIDMPPGHIAGSVSALTDDVAISGTFDNVFCPDMIEGVGI